MTELNISPDDVELIQISIRIIPVLRTRSAGMSEDDRILYIYNEAIDDAANFARDMGNTNPQHRLEFEALSREIRKWLTIRRPE